MFWNFLNCFECNIVRLTHRNFVCGTFVFLLQNTQDTGVDQHSTALRARGSDVLFKILKIFYRYLFMYRVKRVSLPRYFILRLHLITFHKLQLRFNFKVRFTILQWMPTRICRSCGPLFLKWKLEQENQHFLLEISAFALSHYMKLLGESRNNRKDSEENHRYTEDPTHKKITCKLREGTVMVLYHGFNSHRSCVVLSGRAFGSKGLQST